MREIYIATADMAFAREVVRRSRIAQGDDPPLVNILSENEVLGPLCDRLDGDVHLIKCRRLWPLDKGGRLIVYHDGDLEKYRGRSPLGWAVAHGEPEVIVTKFIATDAVDYGPILDHHGVPVPRGWEPLAMLLDRVCDAYAHLLRRHFECEEPRYPPFPAKLGRVWPLRTRPHLEFSSKNHCAEEIYWGLRASGSPYLIGYLDNRSVVWARLEPWPWGEQAKPGTWTEIAGDVYRVTCADGREVVVEVEVEHE